MPPSLDFSKFSRSGLQIFFCYDFASAFLIGQLLPHPKISWREWSKRRGKCTAVTEIRQSGNRICCRLGRQQVGTAGENRFGSQIKPNPLGPGGRNRSALEYAHKKCVKDYAPRLLIRCIPPPRLAPTQVHASSTQTRVCLISPWRGTCRNTLQPCRARRGRCARRRACRTPSCPPR